MWAKRWVLLAGLVVWGCGSGEAGEHAGDRMQVTPAAPGQPYESLSQWNLFADFGSQEPAERVVPFRVRSVLWSDAASKHRFVYLPEGEVIGYQPEDKWDFPVGSILVKTFAMLADVRDAASDERLLETRLLVHEPDGWVGHVYVYDEAERDAARKPAGATIPVDFIDAQGEAVHNEYGVPNTNQCQECHGQAASLDTLGGRTRQLHLDWDYGNGPENQIDHFASLGWLDQAPPPAELRPALPDPLGDGPVSGRARSYFDANCGHCHSSGGSASSSGLLLDWTSTDPETQSPINWGVCKSPTSAGGATCGLTYDVLPANPDESILLCRVATRDPKVQMPPLASRLPHAEGIALLREWIAGMPSQACN